MSAPSDVFILPLAYVLFPGNRSQVQVQPRVFRDYCSFSEKYDRAELGVIARRANPKEGEAELYEMGTLCHIASHAETTTTMGEREMTVVTLTIEGRSRFKVKKFKQKSPHYVATIGSLEERAFAPGESKEVDQLARDLQQSIKQLLKDSSGPGSNLKQNVWSGAKQPRWPTSPSVLADMATTGLVQLTVAEKQLVLETPIVQKRLKLVNDLVKKVAEVQKLSKEISSKTQKRSEDELRETVLRRQLSQLKREMRKLKAGKGAGRGNAEAEGEEEDEPEEEEEGGEDDDMSALRESLKKAQLSAEAQKIAQRELKRLQNIQPFHPEYTVSRTYLETLASLPWADGSKDDLDLHAAHEILEEDHYGLEKVKRRILEFLAVQKMRGDMKGPILCLHGPPGVGKTSLGRSVARALGRKFHRVALGGVRDEAELRGHRRTYIGAMPGVIMQALTSVKVNNPVILLDEVDKLTKNSMFNPSGAMLELLDPEQNHTFKDHYINTPFDLSKVLFLCTCNDLSTIDRPLLDRMEVIELSGYTVEEKTHIATMHLLPKQRRLHALEANPAQPQLGDPKGGASEAQEDASTTAADSSTGSEPDAAQSSLTPKPPSEGPLLLLGEGTVSDLIMKWTVESGVRSLERRLAQICRWAALRLAARSDGTNIDAASSNEEEEEQRESERLAEAALTDVGPDAMGRITVQPRHLRHIIGAELFEPDLAERLSVGVSMGLGVTQTGGQLLFVEASRGKGTGRLTVTGQLGDVMRESVSTAMSLLRSKIYGAVLASNGEVQPVVRVGSPATAFGEPGPAQPAPTAPSPLADMDAAAEQGNKFQDVFRNFITHGDATKDPFDNDDIHVHFPAGAIPKDGPSAGVATTLALASLLLNRPVRSDTAVTGEITLRGHILPVGGTRDKVLAAHRAGIKHVILPFANQRNVRDDLPAAALNDLQLHFLKHIDQALAWAFADGQQTFPPDSTGNAAPNSSSDPSGYAQLSML